MKIEQELIEELILDPVMAAKVIMNAELDVFQQARLRYYWWTPVTVDSSGISSGKTIVQFIYVNLRCILIGDHVGAIFFPNFQVGKDEFWDNYFPRFIEESSVFREQFVFHHGKVGEHKYPGAYIMDYKNKSRLLMPAPSFMTDSQTQASRRFNTLIVDDWLRAEDMGEGISKQLVDRVTRACFNKNHPIWCNHQKFLGHAEEPSHKGYQTRVKGYRRAILDGSQRHSLISFNYTDWTPKFAQKYREDNVIADARRTLTPDQFERQYLGIWSRSGSNYYPESVLRRNCHRYVVPVFSRVFDNEINILGVDIAPGQSLKADYCSAVNYRIVEIDKGLEAECRRKGIEKPPVTLKLENGREFFCSFPFAYMMKNLDAPQISGLIHLFHRVFAYSKIVLDPGGGGLFVYKELMKQDQQIAGAISRVIPLCTRFEPLYADKQPIVSFFKRGGDLDQTIMPQCLTGDDGFVYAIHQRYREAWEAGEHLWPLPFEDRSPLEVKKWRQEQLWAQRILDVGLRQLSNVRQVTKNGVPVTSARGFRMFEARGKKDVAYGSLYAHAGAQLWFHETESLSESEAEAMIC